MAFLGRPEAWPEGAASVEMVETHLSWVFLLRDFAYKMKKPVRLPYLDFTTIDARHRNCLTELVLNRRLAPQVYLDVVPLGSGPQGLVVGGGEHAVDWLVRMRRLPSARTFDTLILTKKADTASVLPIARLLSQFFAGGAPVEIAANEYRARFSAEIEDNRRELVAFGLPALEVIPLCTRQQVFLEHQTALLDARVGRVIEGHGDLRPEHLFLIDPPAIIDCLEFSRELRLLDPVDELGFLALECERLGAPDAAAPFLDEYAAATADRYPASLLHFYQSYRAAVRAKIAVWHNRNGEAIDPGHWIARAQEYLRLAAIHAEGF